MLQQKYVVGQEITSYMIVTQKQGQSRRPDATAITCTPGRSHVPPGDHILPRACPVPDLAS